MSANDASLSHVQNRAGRRSGGAGLRHLNAGDEAPKEVDAENQCNAERSDQNATEDAAELAHLRDSEEKGREAPGKVPSKPGNRARGKRGEKYVMACR